MKKILCLLTGILALTFSAFAQYKYNELNDMPGVCVSYINSDGYHLNIVNVGETYVASYFNSEEIFVAEFKMKKGHQTEYEIVECFAGSNEECWDKLIKAVNNIVSYGDFGYRDNVLQGVNVKRKDLNGKLLSSAILDFYIPITNVVSVSDGDGNSVSRCVYIGYLGTDEVNSFLTAEMDYSSAVMREMKKVKAKKSQSLTFGNIDLKLPKNFEFNSEVNAYVLNDTTKMDSAIQTATINLDELELEDINSYVLYSVLTAQGIVLPEKISVSQEGDVKIMRIDFIDYNYGEYNTCMQCILQKDERTLEVLVINGYTSFIDLNIDMYKGIIKSMKLKK